MTRATGRATGADDGLLGRPESAPVGRLDPDRHLARIVGEVAPPYLGRRPRHELVARLDRLDRVSVIGARPAHRDLPERRNEIPPEDRAFGGIACPPSWPLDAHEDSLGTAGAVTVAHPEHAMH